MHNKCTLPKASFIRSVCNLDAKNRSISLKLGTTFQKVPAKIKKCLQPSCKVAQKKLLGAHFDHVFILELHSLICYVIVYNKMSIFVSDALFPPVEKMILIFSLNLANNLC